METVAASSTGESIQFDLNAILGSKNLTGIQYSVGIEGRLDLAHDVERHGVLPVREPVALQLPDAVLGGERAGIAGDYRVDDLVHRLPSTEESGLVRADRLADVEMN